MITNGNCVFCRIISGELSAHLVFEDAETFAFLDAYPLARGHTLVIPKVHVARLEDLEWEDAKMLFQTVYNLVSKVQEAVEATASIVAINNGSESGQEIPHVHVHIIPRFRNDGGGPIHAIMSKRPRLNENEMNKIAKRIFNHFS